MKTNRKKILRALFFDIDDTLYSSSEFSAMARLNGIKALIKNGLRMEIKECLAIVNRIMRSKQSNYNALFNDLLTEAGEDKYPFANPHVLIASAVAAYHQTKTTALKPYPDVVEVLKIFSQTTPLNLGVISSGKSVKQAEKLYRCGLSKYFHPRSIFFSESLGVDKPSRNFFINPCKSVGVKPEEALYVGDRPNLDVAPVRALGMVSVLNRRSGKYIDEPMPVAPNAIVHDFWQLLDFVTSEFELHSPADS